MTLDHKDQTLHITWQKDNQDEASQCENVMNLSGGERSFTTLSLLLAIGEVGEIDRSGGVRSEPRAARRARAEDGSRADLTGRRLRRARACACVCVCVRACACVCVRACSDRDTALR